MRSLVLSLIALFAAAGALAAEPDGLTKEQRAQLARDKIIVTGQTWRQIFSPYIFAGQPVFITSDSVLHAYHVLLEESAAQMESRQALRIAAVLEGMLAQIKPEPADGASAEAIDRARLVLGTAARLAGSHWSGGAAVDEIIATEAKRVEAAEGLHLPAWMKPGHGLEALDYRVFKPAGFYTRSASLQRYFRALRWLQAVPFRIREAEELAAASVVGAALWQEGSLPVLAAQWASLSDAAAAPALSLMDDFRWSPEKAIEAAAEQHTEETACLFVFPSALLPDAELMERTTGARRPYPDPLDVGAWLGSPLALRLITETEDAAVLKEIEAKPDPETQRALYSKYMQCLRKLLEAPEPGAPPFLSTTAWERKSLNTALAGWAIMRHTWALQAKENASYFPAARPYPGFVEPCPAFFQALSQLILQTVERFEDLDALAPSPQLFAAEAAALIPMVERESEALRRRMEPWLRRLAQRGGLTDTDRAQIEKDGAVSEELSTALKPVAEAVEGVDYSIPGPRVNVYDVDKLLASLREAAAGNRTAAFLKSLRENGTRTLRSRWLRLLSVTQKLESRAHRQLRGIEPDHEEANFIVDYGEILGGILFYDGNSYHNPRDDAPLAAAVFNQAGGQFLIAGTGRPREIRVLYPWKGKEILCRGAILPFHAELCATHLTDQEWRARLDSEMPPATPAWLRPILSPDAPAKKPEK